MNGQPALTYESANPNEYRWTQQAYDALTNGTMKASVGGQVGARQATISGPCPRCGHEVHFEQILDAVVGENGGLKVLGDAIDIETPRYLELVCSCRCTEAHEHRPEGVTVGCGINFRVDLLDPR